MTCLQTTYIEHIKLIVFWIETAAEYFVLYSELCNVWYYISLIVTKVSCFEPRNGLSGETKPKVEYLKKLVESNYHHKYPFS